MLMEIIVGIHTDKQLTLLSFYSLKHMTNLHTVHAIKQVGQLPFQQCTTSVLTFLCLSKQQWLDQLLLSLLQEVLIKV